MLNCYWSPLSIQGVLSPALNFKVKCCENEVGHSVQVARFAKYNHDNNKEQGDKNQRHARMNFILKKSHHSADKKRTKPISTQAHRWENSLGLVSESPDEANVHFQAAGWMGTYSLHQPEIALEIQAH